MLLMTFMQVVIRYRMALSRIFLPRDLNLNFQDQKV